MRRTTKAYWRSRSSLTDEERRKLRGYGMSVDAIAKRMGMESRTIEALVTMGGTVMQTTVERARKRMEELDRDDASTDRG
jgi:hypothetical protein